MRSWRSTNGGFAIWRTNSPLSVANIIDVKFADSDQLIRGFGDNHHQVSVIERECWHGVSSYGAPASQALLSFFLELRVVAGVGTHRGRPDVPREYWIPSETPTNRADRQYL
jgi:hypothetical protein